MVTRLIERTKATRSCIKGLGQQRLDWDQHNLYSWIRLDSVMSYEGKFLTFVLSQDCHLSLFYLKTTRIHLNGNTVSRIVNKCNRRREFITLMGQFWFSLNSDYWLVSSGLKKTFTASFFSQKIGKYWKVYTENNLLTNDLVCKFALIVNFWQETIKGHRVCLSSTWFNIKPLQCSFGVILLLTEIVRCRFAELFRVVEIDPNKKVFSLFFCLPSPEGNLKCDLLPKNTIRDGGSTALHTLHNVYTLYAVDRRPNIWFVTLLLLSPSFSSAPSSTGTFFHLSGIFACKKMIDKVKISIWNIWMWRKCEAKFRNPLALKP